jgi:hypothetical protein
MCRKDEMTKLGFNKATGELDFIRFVREQILTRNITRQQTSKTDR